MQCDKCRKEIVKPDHGGTGYATVMNLEMDNQTYKGEFKVCYDCCARIDLEWMRDKGKTVLYLSKVWPNQIISNWPGSLKFSAIWYRKSKHRCFAGLVNREDVWFYGPDIEGNNKAIWHGVVRGDMELCRCQRTKYKYTRQIPS